MAKKPTDQTRDDQPDRAALPPEPADLFEAVAHPALPADDTQLIDEADLFDFTDPPTEAPPPPVAVPAAAPADDDDILAWDALDDGSSVSFVGRRGDDSGSSILSSRAATSGPGSGWLDAMALADGAPDPDAFPIRTEAGPSSSGVNLQDPDGVADAESESSIFGRGAADQSSRVVIPLPRSSEDDDATSGPESLWEEAAVVDGQRPTAGEDDADVVSLDTVLGRGGKDRPFAEDEPDADLQPSLRTPRPDLDEPADDDLRAWLEEETRPVEKKPASGPVSDSTGVGLSIGSKPPVPAPSTPRRAAAPPVLGPEYDLEGDDDEPVKASPKRPAAKPAAEKQTGKSSAMGWVGGGLLGLLVGGAGVFGLSQAGILGDDTSKPIVTTPPKGVAPDPDKLAEVQKAADAAEAARVEAVKKLGDAETQFAAAKKAADKASTDLIEATKKQLEFETAWTKARDAGDVAVKELAAAKDDLKTAMKNLTTANNVLDDVRTKAKAADDVLAGLVKEFKAAKLIPEDADAAAALAKLPDAARNAATAAASGDAKKAAEALAAAKKEVDVAQASLKTATDDLAKAKTDADKALKLADDRAKQLADVVKAAKGNDDAIAALVKEFKAAKLIDADADAATALAKLPDAAKKAASAAVSGDAAKAAEALLTAKKELDVAQAAVKKAEADLDAAKKLADAAKIDAAKLVATAKAETAKAVKTAQDEGAKAVADAKKEADDKAKEAVAKALAETDAKLKAADTAAKAAEARALADAQAKAVADAKAKAATDALAMKEADFARQLAAAQANAPLGAPLAALDAVVEEKAMAAYAAGTTHYFAGRYADAEKQFRAAGASDARFRYYLGLALLAQGQTEAAAESFTAGAVLERRNRPNARDIGDALERIQGPARRELSKFRPQ